VQAERRAGVDARRAAGGGGAWRTVAGEGGAFAAPAGATLRYGAEGHGWATRLSSGAHTEASNASFHWDPAPGVKKVLQVWEPPGGGGGGGRVGSGSPALARALAAVTSTREVCAPLGEAPDVEGVLRVLAARVEVASLTGLFARQEFDVTEGVAAALDARTGVLGLRRAQALGLLLRPGQTALIGTRTLRVWVCAAATPTSAGGGGGGGGAPAAVALGRALAAEGLLDGAARAGNAANNFYKLPEWLQVELVQLFGASMEHTPWFRFPFFAVLRGYAGVLAQETRVVAARMGGLANAVATNGFVTDAIPGVVMLLLFAQLAALAYPLRLALGERNEDAEGRFEEELLFSAPCGAALAAADARLAGARAVADGIFVCAVPTFKPLTEVLANLACAVPAAQLLLVSNHAALQVKLVAAAPEGPRRRVQEAALEAAKGRPGCEALFDFAMPDVGGGPPPKQLALAVGTHALLPLLRFCRERDLQVQVYDFN
jgi:hypothetical protein